MGLSNSPDIFQEKMNEFFNGLEYIRTYIDDILIISKKSFENYISKPVKILSKLSKLKRKGLK